MRLRLIMLAILIIVAGQEASGAEKYVAPNHHLYHEWYQTIQSLLMIGGCCDEANNDCGPVDSYLDLNSGAKVLLEDRKWHDTGDNVQKYYVDTPDGKAHACRQPDTNNFGFPTGKFTFYCLFLPRPMM